MRIPTIIPAPRRVHRKRRVIAPPAHLGLLITEVRIHTPWQLIVSFSGPIAWNGVDVPGEFESFTDDGFYDSPVGVISAGANWIELEFNGPTPPGNPWRVNATLTGITPAVAFPQSGTVIA